MTKPDQQTGLIAAIRGCASWQDIQAKWRDYPEKQKGDLFEELVKAYFQPTGSRRFTIWSASMPRARMLKLRWVMC